MRGKANRNRKPWERSRITPAYAGKSQPWKIPQLSGEDHPRLCGEKGMIAKKNDTDEGSPPPMRGKVQFG